MGDKKLKLNFREEEDRGEGGPEAQTQVWGTGGRGKKRIGSTTMSKITLKYFLARLSLKKFRYVYEKVVAYSKIHCC